MAVVIRRGVDIRKNIEDIFAELYFKPGRRVYVKPNLSGRSPVIPGENTSVEVMDALIEVLHSFDSEVIIGHGALLGSFDQKKSFEETLSESGFDKYKNQQGAKVINLDDLERTTVKESEMDFHLPLKFLREEVDTYINLAKIKTHMETMVSFSLKNQMGLPASPDRVMMHKTDLEKTIAKIALYCKPDLAILEGYPAMENNGPHHGTPRDLQMVAGSRDMLELDSFVCEILGIDSGQVKHFKHAKELGIGQYFNTGEIGRHKDFLVNDYKQAKKVYKFGRRVYAYPTYACSRCIFAIDKAGKEFKKHPLKYWRFILKALFSRKPIYVIFGKADELSLDKEGEIICIGECAKNFAERYGVKCLDKCPPGVEETRNYLLGKTK